MSHIMNARCAVLWMLVLQWSREITIHDYNVTFGTLRAGPFSLALSLARFPSSPSCTKSSSRFTSSSSTICSVCMFAAMLARALITAREQCLRKHDKTELTDKIKIDYRLSINQAKAHLSYVTREWAQPHQQGSRKTKLRFWWGQVKVCD